MNAHLLACAVVVSGLAAWLSLAVANNIRDRQTNIVLLGRMMRMDELLEDTELGLGLRQRAIIRGSRLPSLSLSIVIVVQIVIAALLWRGAALLWLTLIGGDVFAAINAATLAVCAFTALWFAFLTGGLWFGYWIKMPQVHQVHLTLLTISIGTLVLLGQR
jgi:predicted small integral membrane protein